MSNLTSLTCQSIACLGGTEEVTACTTTICGSLSWSSSRLQGYVAHSFLVLLEALWSLMLFANCSSSVF